MQPIISPFFIYFLSIVDALIGVFIGIAFVSGVIIAFSIIASIIVKTTTGEWSKGEKVKLLSLWKKIKRPAIPIFILTIFLAIFTPSKKALIGMFVVDKITPNNIEKALEAGNDIREVIKKDILELIGAITKQEKKEEQ